MALICELASTHEILFEFREGTTRIFYEILDKRSRQELCESTGLDLPEKLLRVTFCPLEVGGFMTRGISWPANPLTEVGTIRQSSEKKC